MSNYCLCIAAYLRDAICLSLEVVATTPQDGAHAWRCEVKIGSRKKHPVAKISFLNFKFVRALRDAHAMRCQDAGT